MRVDIVAGLDDASVYYDERHARGWMDIWPDDKKKRVIELIKNTGIRPHAKVLEYGCGVGVFAEAVKQALPSVDVHGCDISTVGVARAAERCKTVTFHKVESDELARLAGTFDLIYTHHVLEHVMDLDTVFGHIKELLKPGGKVLHIVPCANPESLEYNISCLSEAGIDSAGRFCCDDSSHVRRLTSADLVESCQHYGLILREALFANQLWGGVDYLTREYHWTLLGWLNPTLGKSAGAKLKLLFLMLLLGAVCILRNGPNYVFSTIQKPIGIAKRLLFAFLVPPAILMYPFAVACEGILRRLRDREWTRDRQSPNGSEMYCLFEKV